MKTKNTATAVTLTSTESLVDSGKLVSLLALAAGAAAMPQTSHADIIYQNLTGAPQKVGYAGGYGESYQFTLPGTAQVGFQRHERSVIRTFPITTTVHYRTVIAGQLGGTVGAGFQSNGASFAVPRNFGDPWNGAGLGFSVSVVVGVGGEYGHLPNSDYDLKYLAWAFIDSTAGGATRYGWAEVSLSNGNYPGGPNVTIFGYAYDTTGAQLNMGAVPEPSSVGLMALGALALGARGLRDWRRNRNAACKS